jgi:murein DD-endopeptidase MepM/ murein hydrolase activator NlpD
MKMEKSRLREKTLSSKVCPAMHEIIGAIRRALAARFAERKTKAVSALVLFSLLFLFGSVIPPHAAAARAAEAADIEASATGLPSAGGLPARGSGVATTLGTVGSDAANGKEEGDAAVDRGLFYTAYKVARGDTLSGIAENFNVTLDTVVSFNGIRNARTLQPGCYLKVPSMSGILYTAKAGDSAAAVAAANGVAAERVLEANGLGADRLEAGQNVFLPDAKLASFTLREISGDLFSWPARGWISSWYGWRSDPFSGTRSFHNGIDIGVDSGTPVRTAMDGTVSEVGYNSSFGNYIVVYHHAGWMSLYGHLQTTLVRDGQRVTAGQRIALSGNTGYSTGPHLHFSVFKNGRTVNPFNVLH